jgi:hypothetical protein
LFAEQRQTSDIARDGERDRVLIECVRPPWPNVWRELVRLVAQPEKRRRFLRVTPPAFLFSSHDVSWLKLIQSVVCCYRLQLPVFSG